MTFVDSNIWLYAIPDESNGGKREKALALLQEPDLCFSTQVVNEVLSNILKQQIGSERYVQQLLDHMSRDHVILEVNIEDIRIASGLREEYRLSYWDSVIVSSALRANAHTLYSEDMRDGLVVRNKLTIRNPFR